MTHVPAVRGRSIKSAAEKTLNDNCASPYWDFISGILCFPADERHGLCRYMADGGRHADLGMLCA